MRVARRCGFLFYLVLCSVVVVPLGNDIFIAGIPAMEKVFPGEQVSLTMSIALLGLAVSQPFYGPLLDRFGRRPVLIGGLVLCTLAGILTISTHNFTWLIIGRFFRAMGACSAIVSVLAIVRDTFPKDRMIYATSIIMGIIGVCPTIAPLLGSILTMWKGWSASFVFLFLLALFFTLVIILSFKETQAEKNMTAHKLGPLINNYRRLIQNKSILSSCLI